jgi:biotin operon repressor
MTDTIVSATPRQGTKSQRLLTMLQTGTGASLDEMTEATGWQAHTVRAAMTGFRKRGFTVERHVEGNTTVWSVQAAGE